MNILSDRIRNLSESATLEMTRKSRELKAQGKNVINLSIGEPDFNTPECIKDAAKKAIDDNQTHYTPVAGTQELRQAIAEKFKKDNKLDYSFDQIIVSNGAKQSIANALLCIVNPGDEVIVPAPYWVSYPEMIKLAEGKMVVIPTTVLQDFKATPEQVEEAITPKTKVFLFNSPNNPSGSVYTKDELKGIADVFAKYENIFVISDEIYEYINYAGKHESIAQFEQIRNRVITINGVSKGFAMTGWRIGYMAASLEIAKACDKFQGQITSGASSISQLASLEAMKIVPCASSEMKEMIDTFKSRRDLLFSKLNETPGIKANLPDGAFYIFANVADYYGKSNGSITIHNDTDLCLFLLENALVATVPGAAFGDPDCIRISYATSTENLLEAMERIRKSLSELS
ncbi:MAG: pyridoxal phosphate-dependent aminotransferase [Bacteroidales bacterium]|nr:pyridoxal phosphate-dependent aminotransferase [Bacteroidales bacterium]